MKKRLLNLLNVIVTTALLASILLVNITSSGVGEEVVGTSGFGAADVSDYDPWADLNDDGKIDIMDIATVAIKFGTLGDSITKASIENDTGWIDITDKAGQYFNITHNLNSTDIIVDIQGKTTLNGGVHQRHLGGTGYTPGWNQTYGGENTDTAHSMVQTADGGYAIAGRTLSFGAGSLDVWLVKTDSAGKMQWNRTYGGANEDVAFSVVQTSDGGYAMAGYTDSFGAGGQDLWLVKTDSAGNMQWNRTYGGAGNEGAYSLVQTSDGGYAMGANIGPWWDLDFWLVKTDAGGNMEWNQTYGGTNHEISQSMVQTSDGGYALVGYTESSGAGFRDFWLVKTDAGGNMEWNQTYGGTSEDWAIDLVQTSDGGYAVTGFTWSFGVSRDAWLVKTDSSGNMLWSKTYGGTSQDGASSVVQTSDGGYALASWTLSFGAGNWDAWLVKTDADGNMEWSQTYGGTNNDAGSSIIQTADGGYTIAGSTNSFGAGNDDFWLIKTDQVGNAHPSFKFGLAWTDSTADTITLYRGATDPWWNYVRVRVWKIKENP